MKTTKKTILLALAAVLVLLFCGGCTGTEATPQRIVLQDRGGAVFYDSAQEEANNRFPAYTDIVLGELQSLSLDKKAKNITVQTALDSALQEVCLQVYEQHGVTGLPFAAVITDVHGKILCAASAGDENCNFATEKTQPYSTFKPLSVYAPALENGTITSATTFPDTPVKQVIAEDGTFTDWPVNGNDVYSGLPTSIRDGIRLSLNTTAVRCLQTAGVSYCMDFLSDKFGVDVSFEREVADTEGDEEVLHYIGLGYLTAGVSAVDMAGYYQIFANGGQYTAPYCVLSVCDETGAALYTADKKAEQVITAETAFIMNNLLQAPFEPGGTADGVQVDGITLGGKTGTGTDFAGSWFVCFSPQYCIAIRHGQYTKNICTDFFRNIAQGIPFDTGTDFPACENVEYKACCAESGAGFTLNCPDMAGGWFTADTVLAPCPVHK